MNENDLFERGLAGEPPISIDFAALKQAGDRRLQRRRTLAVAGAAGIAVIIVIGAALIPRPGAGGATSGPLIPGCAVVLGPTDTGGSSSSVPAPPTLDQAAAQLPASASAAATPGSLDPVRSATATSVSVPSSLATVAVLDQSTVDLMKPPDPLTGVLWASLREWGVSVRATSQYGSLTFESAGPADSAAATGRATSAGGDGMVLVDIRHDAQGAPACRVGELDRRVTYPDGTVVDLTGGTAGASTNLNADVVATMQAHAVAYRPDGTTVIVRADNVVELGDDDPNTAGIRASAGPPLTLTQVQELAVNPAFSITNPDLINLPVRGVNAVPNVIGLTEDQAMAVLEAAGFVRSLAVGDATGQPDTRTAGGTVVAQSPAAGESVSADAPIELTLGGFAASVTEIATTAGAPSTAPSTG